MPMPSELPLLIASDLDGTLLQRDGSISARTQQALKGARAAGIELVMVTGRPARHVAKIEGAAALGGIVICVNGASVVAATHELTLSNEEDGVAVVVERLLSTSAPA